MIKHCMVINTREKTDKKKTPLKNTDEKNIPRDKFAVRMKPASFSFGFE